MRCLSAILVLVLLLTRLAEVPSAGHEYSPDDSASRKRPITARRYAVESCRKRDDEARVRSGGDFLREAQRQKRIARFAQRDAPAGLGIVVDRRCGGHAVVGGLVTQRGGERELAAGLPGS